jgi:hypothetical protein
VATVEQVALQMVDADGLLKAAFGLSFQQKHTSAFDKVNTTKLAGVRQAHAPTPPPFRNAWNADGVLTSPLASCEPVSRCTSRW